MLTLAELQSTLQIEYELRLEAMDEQALHALLADPIKLRTLTPAHMSHAEGRQIAQATLEQLLARKSAGTRQEARPKAEPLWAQWFRPFWMP
jgi:hypothetical protein